MVHGSGCQEISLIPTSCSRVISPKLFQLKICYIVWILLAFGCFVSIQYWQGGQIWCSIESPTSQGVWNYYTPPKTNISSENQRLEDAISLWDGPFGDMLIFGGTEVTSKRISHAWASGSLDPFFVNGRKMQACGFMRGGIALRHTTSSTDVVVLCRPEEAPLVLNFDYLAWLCW